MEERFRYDCSGLWFKGNIHMHTTRSDGRLTVAEAADFYAEAGYDFICITDHMVPFVGDNFNNAWPLLILDGIELHGEDDKGVLFHAVCVGEVRGITTETGFMEALGRARARDCILIWAHPHWSGNTAADGMRHNFHGIEVCNYSSQVGEGKGMGAYHWDAVLEQHGDMLGFAVDDSHFFEGATAEPGAWIMVNAPELSPHAVTASIRAGNFYSSTGPVIDRIWIERGNRLVVETSPVMHVRLIGPRDKAKWKNALGKEPMTHAHFRIPDDWSYARLEIEDAQGKTAWTNPLLRARS